MTIEEIIDNLKMRNKELEYSLNKSNKKLDFYKDFQKNNRFDTLANIQKVDYADVILAYLIATYPNEDYTYLKEKIEELRIFVTRAPSELFRNVIQMISTFVKEEPYGGNIDQDKDSIVKLIKIKSSKQKSSITGINGIVAIAILYNKYFDAMQKITYTIYAFKIIKEEMSKINFENKNQKAYFEYYQKKYLKDLLEDIEYKKEIDIIANYIDELKNYDKQERKKIFKELNDNKTLLNNIICKKENTFITDYRNMVQLVPDVNLKKDLLLYIYKHNEKAILEIEEKYKKLSENIPLKYRILLNEYGISEKDYDISKIMKNDYQEVNSILKNIEKLSMTKDRILHILEESNLATINLITNYIDAGVLDCKFLEKNSELLIPTSIPYNNFQKNLELLKEKEINPVNFINSGEVLIENSTIIDNNLNDLEGYDYIKSIRGIQNYQFLKKDNLASLMDKYIELGMESILEDQISLLNEEKVDRLVLLKQLNILDELSLDEMIEILHKQFDIVPDNQLKDYLYISEENEKLPVNYEETITELKDYEVGNRTYMVNGYLLSKNRVKRNYQNMDSRDEKRLEKSLLLHSIYESQPQKLKIYKNEKYNKEI